MGCWNETCMISHLPILGGEKCTAVILLKREFPNVGFNAVNEYIPIATIHGEYDGYGCLETLIMPRRLPFYLPFLHSSSWSRPQMAVLC